MKRLIACASVMLALSGQAIAADLYVPEQPVETPVAEPIAAASGWYLRGDLSYDFVNMKGAKYFKGSNGLVDDFTKAEVDNSGNIGLGVGYQINDNFRVDTTFDYMFSADFRGSTTGRTDNTGSVCDVGCKSRDVSAMTAYSLMANAYVDITKIGIVTPYLGAGLGGTYVKWDDLRNTACASNNPNNCDPTVTHNGREGWRFTYAVMAGASIDINCQLKGDVGYRYRHVTGGDMFGYKLNGGPGRDKGFDIHEGRAGLRYNFGGCDQQAYLPPVDMPMQQQPVFK